MHFDLMPNTILVTLAGSRAYGTHTESSDVDLKGVVVAPRKIRDGFLYAFEQADKPEHIHPLLSSLPGPARVAAEAYGLEGTLFELRKFMSLAADANPNILDALFAHRDDVVKETFWGTALRDARHTFLSKKALHTFRGYAMAQLKRIETHRKWLLSPPTHAPQRSEFGLKVLPEIPTSQRDAALGAIRRRVDKWSVDYGTLDEAGKIFIQEQISSYLADLECSADDKWTRAGRLLGMDDNLLDELRKERMYEDAQSYWRKYQEWKTGRNPARAAIEAKYGYDCKHGMHLVRLLLMCREILVEGTVHVRRPDAAFLCSIREGAWPYEKLLQWAQQQDTELIDVAKRSSLPHSPDREKLNDLCLYIHAEFDVGVKTEQVGAK